MKLLISNKQIQVPIKLRYFIMHIALEKSSLQMIDHPLYDKLRIYFSTELAPETSRRITRKINNVHRDWI